MLKIECDGDGCYVSPCDGKEIYCEDCYKELENRIETLENLLKGNDIGVPEA